MESRAPITTMPIVAIIAAALLGGGAPLAAQTLVVDQAPASQPATSPVAAIPAPPALPPAPIVPTAPAAAPAPAAPLLPAAPAVEAYYQVRGNAPIWLRDAGTLEAAKMLPSILRRAQLDGLADAPELARLVAAALARAQAPASLTAPQPRVPRLLAEDRLLSAAWVQYVRALKAPVPGMAFGDPALAPQAPTPHRVLAEAAKAPSLLQHVQSIAAVNPVYARLRDAAWSQLQLEPLLHLAGAPAVQPPVVESLQRARILPSSGRFLVVNLATARLWAYEDGRVVDSMKVVIGKADTPTPMLAGTIHYITFKPYWNIPTDVARRIVAPLVLKRGVSYLRAAEYEVASDWTDEATVLPPDSIDWKAVAAGTTEIRIRQLPGKNNMMGAIKFGFINDLGIYLHDTPNKNLFAKARRNFSLGCVRVEDAQRLGRWLLGREPVSPSDRPEQHVRLASGVPIYIMSLAPHPGSGPDARATGAQLTSADPLAGDPLAQAPDTAGLGVTGAAAAKTSTPPLAPDL